MAPAAAQQRPLGAARHPPSLDHHAARALRTLGDRPRLGTGFIAFLPRLILALVIVAAFYFLARGVRSLVERTAAGRREHPNLRQAFGRLVQTGLLVLGVLVAATAAFPTFTPADLVSALGIGSIAVGFAFKDIFQNFLAGILILLNKPFVVGDQIIFGDYEGTVEDIQTRATYLKTYDGRRVVIPNADLFTNSVTVNTAFPQRRMEYDIGIGYGDDTERAKQDHRRGPGAGPRGGSRPQGRRHRRGPR